MLFEAETVVAAMETRPIDVEPEIEVPDLEGREREALVKVRVNQRLFRRMVLNGYGSKCCVTGIEETALLVGSTHCAVG